MPRACSRCLKNVLPMFTALSYPLCTSQDDKRNFFRIQIFKKTALHSRNMGGLPSLRFCEREITFSIWFSLSLSLSLSNLVSLDWTKTDVKRWLVFRWEKAEEGGDFNCESKQYDAINEIATGIGNISYSSGRAGKISASHACSVSLLRNTLALNWNTR